MSPSMKSKRVAEYKKLLKEAKKQPGLVDLMKVYGRYDELLTQSQQYLSKLPSTETFSVATSTN